MFTWPLCTHGTKLEPVENIGSSLTAESFDQIFEQNTHNRNYRVVFAARTKSVSWYNRAFIYRRRGPDLIRNTSVYMRK